MDVIKKSYQNASDMETEKQTNIPKHFGNIHSFHIKFQTHTNKKKNGDKSVPNGQFITTL